MKRLRRHVAAPRRLVGADSSRWTKVHYACGTTASRFKRVRRSVCQRHPAFGLTTSTGSGEVVMAGAVPGTPNRCLDEVSHDPSPVVSRVVFPPARGGAVSPH